MINEKSIYFKQLKYKCSCAINPQPMKTIDGYQKFDFLSHGSL